MSIPLTLETFAPRVGERFTFASAGGDVVEVELRACDTFAAGAGLSLHFLAPDATGYLPQQTVALRHDELGEEPLFVVPTGPEAGGMGYQAVIA